MLQFINPHGPDAPIYHINEKQVRSTRVKIELSKAIPPRIRKSKKARKWLHAVEDALNDPEICRKIDAQISRTLLFGYSMCPPENPSEDGNGK